jgi:hypothetical protein
MPSVYTLRQHRRWRPERVGAAHLGVKLQAFLGVFHPDHRVVELEVRSLGGLRHSGRLVGVESAASERCEQERRLHDIGPQVEL